MSASHREERHIGRWIARMGVLAALAGLAVAGWAAIVYTPAPQLYGATSTPFQLPADWHEVAPPTGYGLSFPHDRGLAGCEIQLLQEGGAVSNAPAQGTFLWRFGVLLAVDKGAHALAPWLPIAPQAEVTAVEG